MVSRREFLRHSSLLTVTGWSIAAQPSRLWGDDMLRASQLVEGKDDSMLILGKAPRVLETPLAQLGKHQVTPKSLLFVRNNSDPEGFATVAAASRVGWQVDLTGIVEGEAKITAEALAMLPQVEYEMVLQCSGNSRNLISKASPISGTPWGRGGIGNVKFGGPKLSTVLQHLKLTPRKTALYVATEGADKPLPKEEDFEHCVPLGDALETAILALTMNGEPLPAVHGGPVRFVTPGYYGTNHIKWLNKLRFEDQETPNSNHSDKYRMPHKLVPPGGTYKYNVTNSSPTWRMKIASLITSHVDQQQVSAGTVELTGFAWNDGVVPLVGVLMSTDHGESWRRVDLNRSTSRYAWARWSAKVEVRQATPVWIAAVDELGRTQPVDGGITWNPRGYEWNGMERITLNPS